ncbi:MAG: AI-2E family transporter [Burkholderiales bacterium]|nr:AI-2E family transporter [Burkholderiales bacterium]
MTTGTPIPVVLHDVVAQPASAAGGQPESTAEAAETRVRRRRYSRMDLSLTVLAVIALIAALYFARAFFVPLLIGILASYAMRPMVDGLQACRIPRPVAAALVVAALVGGVSWITYSLSDEAVVMLQKLPDAARKLRHTLSPERGNAPTALQNVQEAADELQGVAADATRKPRTRAVPVPAPDATMWLRDYARAQSALLISVVAQTPIVVLLAYFLLASGDHFRRKLLQFVGSSLTRKKDALRILEEIDAQVQRYLFVTLASNALIAVCTWLAFWAMGVEEAGIWGVAAGVLHFVPYLGSVLVAIAAGVAGFLQFGTLLQALAVAGVALIVASVIGLVFTTWLQSRFAGVNAAVLFIALLFFGWLWGVAGLLLGAPLIAIAKVICDRADALRPAGELLGK